MEKKHHRETQQHDIAASPEPESPAEHQKHQHKAKKAPAQHGKLRRPEAPKEPADHSRNKIARNIIHQHAALTVQLRNHRPGVFRQQAENEVVLLPVEGLPCKAPQPGEHTPCQEHRAGNQQPGQHGTPPAPFTCRPVFRNAGILPVPECK